ncbi:MAG: hypothetical protein ACU0CI_06380 [Shimia sp.]
MISPHLSGYRYALLRPGDVPPPGTFGIEMTDPALAAACIGNLDPQHGGPVGAPSAISVAATMPPPRPGSLLATLRPDADALGAMAVLAWRVAGLPLRGPMRARINAVDRMDRHDRGPWPGAGAVRELWPGAELSALSACCFDAGQPLAWRVARVADWLAAGKLPEFYADRARSSLRCLEISLAERRSAVSVSRGLALVTSDQRGALELGYRHAPTVVATNPVFCFPDVKAGRKHTVAAWSGAGLQEAARLLAQVEHGWGGSPGIIGSPQDRPSILSQDRVAAIVAEAFGRDAA